VRASDARASSDDRGRRERCARARPNDISSRLLSHLLPALLGLAPVIAHDRNAREHLLLLLVLRVDLLLGRHGAERSRGAGLLLLLLLLLLLPARRSLNREEGGGRSVCARGRRERLLSDAGDVRVGVSVFCVLIEK
jgi:hypothetical protein